MWVPSDDEIRALHERHAPTADAFDLVYTHCRIVWRIAEQLLTRDGAPVVDVGLVRAGCLLHDIGVYRLYDATGTLDHANYIRHGVLGHELLRDAGLPEPVCRFCSRHTGVGITRADVAGQRLPIPPGDYVAETEEERLVMYADKFHSKSTPPKFVSAAAYTVAVRRFGEDKAERFAAMVRRYGEPDFDAIG
ncbi:HD domain-containing protein [Dactylosporangium siamense]|uniref:Phosphohydrolase n=1 Tax=Dactylosporangium siamense TaxID=685454 RepID=A0A919UBH0_9ACTN|nr:HD domain-containing protein [Dactylosporangium siamense]GIG45626.1 phosphohydrolase [Dactylosporangium siamense]